MLVVLLLKNNTKKYIGRSPEAPALDRGFFITKTFVYDISI